VAEAGSQARDPTITNTSSISSNLRQPVYSIPPKHLDWNKMGNRTQSAVAHVAIGVTVIAIAHACAITLAHAQSAPPTSAPCSAAPQSAACAGRTEKKPTAAEQFPFPGESPDTPLSTAPAAANPSAISAPGVPDAPTAAPTPAAKTPPTDFPFPGDRPSPSDSSSSSSSSSDQTPDASANPNAAPSADPDKPILKDQGSTGRRILKRVNPPATKLQTDEEREAEDLDVAHYYTQTGDFQGALLRAEDAIKIQPDDPDAHFAVADAARRLNKRDQAIAEYNAYLKLEPKGDKASAARKALARLNP
jgi:hypothetical protein